MCYLVLYCLWETNEKRRLRSYCFLVDFVSQMERQSLSRDRLLLVLRDSIFWQLCFLNSEYVISWLKLFLTKLRFFLVLIVLSAFFSFFELNP